MADLAYPAATPQTPGFPNSPLVVTFDGFTTVNTHATRPAIEDQEMYVCDGWMPLGKSNLRTLPGVGSSVFTISESGEGVAFGSGNIGSTPYLFVVYYTGQIYAIKADGSGSSLIATIGSGAPFNGQYFGISQWGQKYIIFVAIRQDSSTNGYFLWDGTTFYQAGGLGPEITIDSGGFGYTSTPTITAVGGAGTGATFTSTVQNGSVETITVSAVGSGYTYTDSVYLAFSGGGGNTSAVAAATVSGGSITTISVVTGGTGYTSTTSITLLGGGGTGGTATAITSGGSVTSVSITKAGEGYTSAPTVFFADANNSVAQAQAFPMPFGVQGSTVETYQDRVWVANGALIQFTAPGSVSDFSAQDGAGAFASTDSFLRVGFTALKQSNGFLYLIADSSMNYISGVQTSGEPPITTFTNQNVDPQIGTPYPLSVQVFSRNIIFANSFGVHVSYGGAVTKVSAPVDYFFQTPPGYLESAVAVIYGIHVYMLLMPGVVDQISGATVNKLLMWDGQRWWTSQQDRTLLTIFTQEVNSVLTAWGADTTGLFPLFQTPSTGFTKSFQSKLWNTPGYFYLKKVTNVFGEVYVNATSSQPLAISVDNNSSTIGTATDISISSSTGLQTFGYSVLQEGQVIGLTVQTTAPDVTFISLTTIGQVYSTQF